MLQVAPRDPNARHTLGTAKQPPCSYRFVDSVVRERDIVFARVAHGQRALADSWVFALVRSVAAARSTAPDNGKPAGTPVKVTLARYVAD